MAAAKPHVISLFSSPSPSKGGSGPVLSSPPKAGRAALGPASASTMNRRNAPPSATPPPLQPPASKRPLFDELFLSSDDAAGNDDDPGGSSSSGTKRARLSTDPWDRPPSPTPLPRLAAAHKMRTPSRQLTTTLVLIGSSSDIKPRSARTTAAPAAPSRHQALFNRSDDDDDDLPRSPFPADGFNLARISPDPFARVPLGRAGPADPTEHDPILSSGPGLRQPRSASPLPELSPSDASPARSGNRPKVNTLLRIDSSPPPRAPPAAGSEEDELPGATAPARQSKPSMNPSLPEDPKTKPARKSKSSREETGRNKENKKAEQERKKRERESARELKAQEKQRAAALKAEAKERAAALAEANRVAENKKASTKEMIVELGPDLDPDLRGKIEACLAEAGAEHRTWAADRAERMIGWQRRIKSDWNAETNRWEPAPQREEAVHFCLVVMAAEEFVGWALAEGPGGGDIKSHATDLIDRFPGYKIIYLLEGIPAWMRKNRNILNKQFSAQLNRAAAEKADEAEGAKPKRTRKKKAAPAGRKHVSEDTIEDALLQLQMYDPILVHRTSTKAETAEWISRYTQAISRTRYQGPGHGATAAGEGQDDGAPTFCMEPGQVPTRDGYLDTYLGVLQEVGRVTLPIATGIVAEHPTLPGLVKGLREGGPLALEQVHRGATGDGLATGRPLGQAVSRRIHKVFTSLDQTMTGIM